MAHSGEQNARIELAKALGQAVTDLVVDHTELFKQFNDNGDFHNWLLSKIFDMTYNPPERRRHAIGVAAPLVAYQAGPSRRVRVTSRLRPVRVRVTSMSMVPKSGASLSIRRAKVSTEPGQSLVLQPHKH